MFFHDILNFFPLFSYIRFVELLFCLSWGKCESPACTAWRGQGGLGHVQDHAGGPPCTAWWPVHSPAGWLHVQPSLHTCWGQEGSADAGVLQMDFYFLCNIKFLFLNLHSRIQAKGKKNKGNPNQNVGKECLAILEKKLKWFGNRMLPKITTTWFQLFPSHIRCTPTHLPAKRLCSGTVSGSSTCARLSTFTWTSLPLLRVPSACS